MFLINSLDIDLILSANESFLKSMKYKVKIQISELLLDIEIVIFYDSIQTIWIFLIQIDY